MPNQTAGGGLAGEGRPGLSDSPCLENRLRGFPGPNLSGSDLGSLEQPLTAELLFWTEHITDWHKREAPHLEQCFSNLKKKAIIFFRKNFDVA